VGQPFPRIVVIPAIRSLHSPRSSALAAFTAFVFAVAFDFLCVTSAFLCSSAFSFDLAVLLNQQHPT
jgi:hypothetical protein